MGPAEGLTPAHGNYASECASLIIQSRTLVVYGNADKYLHPDNFKDLDAYIADLKSICIEGGSHWLMDECPEQLNDFITAFLADSNEARKSTK